MAPFSSLTKTKQKQIMKWNTKMIKNGGRGVEEVASLRNMPHSLDPCLV